VLRIRDPPFDFWIRDPDGKKSILDDISERLEVIFFVKIFKFFEDADL
jgi:hypothetical protein